jgi:hypothetical protein
LFSAAVSPPPSPPPQAVSAEAESTPATVRASSRVAFAGLDVSKRMTLLEAFDRVMGITL